MMGRGQSGGWLTRAVIACALVAIGLELFRPLPDGGAAYWLFALFGTVLTVAAAIIERKRWLLFCIPIILWPVAVALLGEIYLLLGGDVSYGGV